MLQKSRESLKPGGSGYIQTLMHGSNAEVLAMGTKINRCGPGSQKTVLWNFYEMPFADLLKVFYLRLELLSD